MRTIPTSIVVLFIALNTPFTSQAQELHKSSRAGEGSFGLGLGLPYGGIGARLGVNAADQFMIFGGLGYMLAGVGYNVGLQYSLPSTRQSEFYFASMIGANGATKVQGLSEYDKVYTGFTFGMGLKINSRKSEGNYWDVGLLLPFRSGNFKNQQDAIETDPRVTGFTKAWPVLFTVGYNFNL